MEPKKLSFAGAWTGISAGGCLNYASWRFNPQLLLTAAAPCAVKITLQQAKETDPWHIGFYAARTDGSGYRVLAVAPEDLVGKATFSNVREVSATVALTDPSVPLAVIPCTFKPGQESEFRMSFETSEGSLSVAPIDPALEYRMYTQEGKWEGNSAGGCKNHPSVTNNPQYSIECSKATTVTVTLSQTAKDPFDTIGLYVCKSKSSGSTITNDLGPGLSPVVRPKGAHAAPASSSSAPVAGDSRGSSKEAGGPTRAQRLKAIPSKLIVAKAEFSSDKEAFCVFKANPKYAYTVVPCTFEPNQESNFTLTVFSKRRVKLKSLNQELGDIECSGQWHDESAGGCVNYPSWRNNPQYFVYCKRNGLQVRITLAQKRTFEPYAIGLYVARNSSTAQSRLLVLSADNLVGKTAFEKRREITTTLTLDESDVPYVIIPATFYSGQASKFTLSLHVEGLAGAKPGVPIKAPSVLTMLPCTFLWNQRTIKGEWAGHEMGGCRNHDTWLSNPQVALKLAATSKVVIILAVPDAKDSVGFYVLKDNRMVNQSLRVHDGDAVELVAKSVFRKEEEIALELSLDKGHYKIVLTTFNPGVAKPFELTMFCDSDKFSSVACYEDEQGHAEKLAQSSRALVAGEGSAKGGWRIDWQDVAIEESQLLGQGGYGVVYRGSYKGRVVAVKKMLVELMEESDLAIFKKEISIMDLYHHPNIVEFVGANLTPPAICIVTEYCGKGSLSKVLKTEPNLSWSIKLPMARDTANGMAYLHSQTPPVVHRDLKSLNILVTDDYTAKLCDFGLSKTTSGSSLNSCVGSLNWCAPEVLLRNAPFTKAADVYSMGMVLLELYTHSAPFAGMQPLQIVKAIDSGTSLPIPNGCPRAYGLLIRRCWDDVPKNRPPFTQVAQDLQSMAPESFPLGNK